MVSARIARGTVVRGQLGGTWFVGRVSRRQEDTRTVWVTPDADTMAARGEDRPIERLFLCEELSVLDNG